MATTTRFDIPGYEVVRLLDELRNPVYEVRRMPSEDVFVAKIVGDEYEPHLPGQRAKVARRISRIVGTTVGWVRIDDHGPTADGQTYVVSPLFERGSLADLLDDGDPTPWADAVRWIAGASLSVGNLHAEGVALGFLRPSSILLSDENEALVAIYGLASRRFDDGTFRFEAPEVVDGHPPDTPSDTYSLALILATLLIGRTPAFGESLDEYISNLGHKCPEPIRVVITKSLSSDPGARHATGADFAYSLRGTTEEILAAEYTELTVTTHFDEQELAQHLRQSRGAPTPPRLPPATEDPTTVHPTSPGEQTGPLADLFEMASVTAPIDASILNEITDAAEKANDGGTEIAGISADEALAELDELIADTTDNPFDVPSIDAPAESLAAASDELESSHEGSSDETEDRHDDNVPFIASPTAGARTQTASPDRMQNVAVRVENFWFANRRSIASTLTALAVGAIGAVAIVLAFRSYQDGQTAAVEGAPPPTTEPVVMANLNNDVVFITEPPQTNTTTTTAPPRRRTTTSAAPSSTTGTTAKPADDKKAKPDDEDDTPATTEAAPSRSSAVTVTVTIPPDVDEENGNRRRRGRNP